MFNIVKKERNKCARMSTRFDVSPAGMKEKGIFNNA